MTELHKSYSKSIAEQNSINNKAIPKADNAHSVPENKKGKNLKGRIFASALSIFTATEATVTTGCTPPPSIRMVYEKDGFLGEHPARVGTHIKINMDTGQVATPKQDSYDKVFTREATRQICPEKEECAFIHSDTGVDLGGGPRIIGQRIYNKTRNENMPGSESNAAGYGTLQTTLPSLTGGIIPAAIYAGGMVGAAAALRPDNTEISNIQGQNQNQSGSVENTNWQSMDNANQLNMQNTYRQKFDNRVHIKK